MKFSISLPVSHNSIRSEPCSHLGKNCHGLVTLYSCQVTEEEFGDTFKLGSSPQAFGDEEMPNHLRLKHSTLK